MPDQEEDWFSPGLGSVAGQQPLWPVPQGWGQPQQQAQQPQQQSWFNQLGSSLSNLAGGNPEEYLGAISLAKVGKPMWGEQDYHMMNEQGQKVGNLSASFEKPDLLHIGWEGGGQKNRLGFANSRSVLPELLREYPDAKRFTAFRISGARHGPAARYKGEPHLADAPYMRPIINIPAHIKANPPNQWSGKWLHEDLNRWFSDDEGPGTGRRIPIQTPDETVNTPQELDNLNRNLANWRERLERERANMQRAQGSFEPPRRITPFEERLSPEDLAQWRSDQQSRVGSVRSPAPPAPQPEVTSLNFPRTDWSTALPQFDPSLGQPQSGWAPRWSLPTSQQTPGPFISQPMGQFQAQGREQAIGMGSLYNQPMNLQMLSEQLNRERMGYGGAGSTRMEEE